MNRFRAFFLTTGLGLTAVSLALLLYRPETADMRFREWIGGVMTAGFSIGFASLLIFSHKWRRMNLLATALFGLGLLVMYLGGRFGGQTVGSTGWVIGLILISTVFPGALILLGISGFASLLSAIQTESASRIGCCLGLAVMTALVAALCGVVFKNPDMDSLIASLRDPNAGVRMQAVSELGMIDNIRGEDALLGLLHDRDPVMRAGAALALGNPPHRHRVVGPLTAALRDENSEVRRNAALSLGAVIGSRHRKMYSRTADALLETLKDEKPGVRSASAEALGWIGERRAVEPLIGLLGDPEVRFQAHNALITITGQRLSDDPDEWRAWLEKN